LKCALAARRISIAKYHVDGERRIIEDDQCFIRRSRLYNDIAAASQIVGDYVANENVAIDD
jgi:hypothetical protein